MDYSRPIQYSYYQRKALVEFDFDCDQMEEFIGAGSETPVIFRPDLPMEQIPKMVTVDLVAVRVKKDGKVVASYDNPEHKP